MSEAYRKTAICATIVGVITALLLAQALPAATENPDGPLFLLPAVIFLGAIIAGCVFVAIRRRE